MTSPTPEKPGFLDNPLGALGNITGLSPAMIREAQESQALGNEQGFDDALPAPPPSISELLVSAPLDAHVDELEKYGTPPLVPATVNASVPLSVTGEPATLMSPPVNVCETLETLPLPAPPPLSETVTPPARPLIVPLVELYQIAPATGEPGSVAYAGSLSFWLSAKTSPGSKRTSVWPASGLTRLMMVYGVAGFCAGAVAQ